MTSYAPSPRLIEASPAHEPYGQSAATSFPSPFLDPPHIRRLITMPSLFSYLTRPGMPPDRQCGDKHIETKGSVPVCPPRLESSSRRASYRKTAAREVQNHDKCFAGEGEGEGWLSTCPGLLLGLSVRPCVISFECTTKNEYKQCVNMRQHETVCKHAAT